MNTNTITATINHDSKNGIAVVIAGDNIPSAIWSAEKTAEGYAILDPREKVVAVVATKAQAFDKIKAEATYRHNQSAVLAMFGKR